MKIQTTKHIFKPNKTTTTQKYICSNSPKPQIKQRINKNNTKIKTKKTIQTKKQLVLLILCNSVYVFKE